MIQSLGYSCAEMANQVLAKHELKNGMGLALFIHAHECQHRRFGGGYSLNTEDKKLSCPEFFTAPFISYCQLIGVFMLLFFITPVEVGLVIGFLGTIAGSVWFCLKNYDVVIENT